MGGLGYWWGTSKTRRLPAIEMPELSAFAIAFRVNRLLFYSLGVRGLTTFPSPSVLLSLSLTHMHLQTRVRIQIQQARRVQSGAGLCLKVPSLTLTAGEVSVRLQFTSLVTGLKIYFVGLGRCCCR